MSRSNQLKELSRVQAASSELPGGAALPTLAVRLGKKGLVRFLEFFTVNIRNRNTREAYGRAAGNFLRWCEEHGIDELSSVQPVHVAQYIEGLQDSYSKPTIKQHLACIRMMFDWLVVGQVVPENPAKAVRGPKHSVAVGSTPVLSAEEARQLLDSIDTSTLIGLRDRALIGLMVYSFSRIEAAISMRVEDFYPERRRWWVRLREKGGKVNKMPCHHNLEAYLHEYIDAARLKSEPKSPLFRSLPGRAGSLTSAGLDRKAAWVMVRRRAKAASIETSICNHTFRATGITEYLRNGGKVEVAQQMAGHSDPRTTKLYDRRSDEVSLDEVERILI